MKYKHCTFLRHLQTHYSVHQRGDTFFHVPCILQKPPSQGHSIRPTLQKCEPTKANFEQTENGHGQRAACFENPLRQRPKRAKRTLHHIIFMRLESNTVKICDSSRMSQVDSSEEAYCATPHKDVFRNHLKANGKLNLFAGSV